MEINRSYKRRKPSRSSRLIIVFCEGKATEPKYFEAFKQKSSRLHLEVYTPDEANPKNTPEGLLARAKAYKKKNTELRGDDTIWLVFDTDQNSNVTLKRVRSQADSAGIYLSQSNPCFEVWLLYHYIDNTIPNDAPATQQGWKDYLNQMVSGGVRYKDCVERAERAVRLAENAFQKDTDDIPEPYSTECYLLMKEILELL